MHEALKQQEDFGGRWDKILKHCFIFQKTMSIQLQVIMFMPWMYWMKT